MSRPLLVLALLALAAPTLAGCLAGPPDLPLTPLAATLERFDGAYTFPPAVLHDGTGALLDAAGMPAEDEVPVAVERLVPGDGAEPTLGVTSSGAIFVTTFDQVRRSRDHGATWEVVHDLVTPGHPVVADLSGTADPMLWVDPVTDRVYVDHMHPALLCTQMAWSDDDGESFTERPFACGLPYVDHQKLMTAPPGPAAPLPMPTYPNVLYLCVNKMELGTSCSVSLDGGLTFAYERQAYVNDRLCGNVNGHPAAFPDGTVAMVLGNLGGAECERPLTVLVTEDNGLTWTARQCDPDLDQVEIDADVTVTPDGTAYVLYRDADQAAHLLRSRDKFLTCDHFRVAPPDHALSAFAGITSGDDGRIAMAYLGTRDPQPPGATPSNATLGTRWHLFVTTSLDAGADVPSFLTLQATPEEDPVQVGCIWMQGGSGGPDGCRNLLDFIDMARDADGRFYVAITDGCTPRTGCAGTPGQPDFQSRDRQVAVVVQDRGASLLAAKGVLPSLGLRHPDPLPRD